LNLLFPTGEEQSHRCLVSFGQTIEALAEDSVQRWRSGLAKDLKSMTEILVRSFQAKITSGGKEPAE